MMMLSTEKQTALAVAAGASGTGASRDAIKLPRTPPAKLPAAASSRDGKERWPAEVELILSALEAASSRGSGAGRQQQAARDARGAARMRYRVRATLRLFSDADGAPPWLLYTRDANPRGLGFLTPHRLPLGYGGMIEVVAPSGETLRVACTLLRCRQVTNGWYEGSLYFNREQEEFTVA